MYFLAIHEVPCFGTLPLVIEADTYEQAYDIAFDQSCKPHHVMGGFDLYRITYDHTKHSHTLRDVTRELDYEIGAYPHDDFEDEILPCDLDPFGECPKPEYARDCAKCRGWTQAEAKANAIDS